MLISRFYITDNLNKWNYVLKISMILDRCIEEKFFLYDISELNLSQIQFFKDEDRRISIFNNFSVKVSN